MNGGELTHAKEREKSAIFNSVFIHEFLLVSYA
jgi:hypothetical protein